MAVRRPAHESTIQRIGRLASDAKASRPRLVTVLDAVAERWSYALVASTLVIAAVPPLLWQAPVGPSLYRSLAWLITASPCALILSAPMVYVSGLSVAAANGVLLRGGRTLDALAAVTGVAFDKTGTITTGSPTLRRVEVLGEPDSEEAVRQRGLLLASALSRLSVHPVSRGLVAAAPPGKRAEVADFQMVTGAGVSGTLALPGEQPVHAALGRPVFVARQLEQLSGGTVIAEAIRGAAQAHEDGGAHEDAGGAVAAFGTITAGAVDGATHAHAWLFHFEHRLKSSAAEVLAKVSRSGPIYMLTGDRQASALRVAEEIGKGGVTFTGVHAELRPEGKLARVRELDTAMREREAGSGSLLSGLLRALGVSTGGLAMVGDGVNDAPALAAATAGISLAAQAEGALPTAIEGSDVLVLRRAGDPAGDNDLVRVQWTFALARRARCIMLQNVVLALGSIGGVSALTLCTAMPLWLSVLLHEGTTMLVGLNSLRLLSQLRWRSPGGPGSREHG
uniref:Uncharacterized protein n=1 Tax=Pyrodinium bahamense TaxID=73915 RepID=A0A7S0BDH3_9DINO